MAGPFPDAPRASAPYSGLDSDGSEVNASTKDIDHGIERAAPKPSDGGDHVADDSDTSDYRSFDSDSDNELDDGGGEADTRTAEELGRREDERKRVLEAAGLIIMHDTSTLPPVPPRRRASKKRIGRGKALPPVPKLKKGGSNNEKRELPPPPPSSTDSILEADDAFSRYEQFKQQQPNTNRFSVVSVTSVETTPGSPPSISHSLTPSVTRESDTGKTSNSLLSFFGLGSTQITASTSGERRTANISGPIITAVDPSISRENSPTLSFGIVSNSFLRLVPSAGP
jgi:actin cytoskeleton-regulatory complex protein PAN1